MRIFDAVESKQQAGFGTVGRVGCVEILNREKLLRADQRYDALMGRGLGELSQLLARLLANAKTGFAAEGDKVFKALVVAFAGYQNFIEAPPSGLDGLFDRMQPVQNFHSG